MPQMTMRLELESGFRKRSKKFLNKNPSLKNAYENMLTKLADDPFEPTLLSGELYGKYACSLTYSLRVVFKLNDDIVHLLDIGHHDEVY